MRRYFARVSQRGAWDCASNSWQLFGLPSGSSGSASADAWADLRDDLGALAQPPDLQHGFRFRRGVGVLTFGDSLSHNMFVGLAMLASGFVPSLFLSLSLPCRSHRTERWPPAVAPSAAFGCALWSRSTDARQSVLY